MASILGLTTVKVNSLGGAHGNTDNYRLYGSNLLIKCKFLQP